MGIYAENKGHNIVGVLGVLKAGGAFIGLEPGIHGDELLYILDDSCCRVLLTDKAGMLPDLDLNNVSVHEMGDDVKFAGIENEIAPWNNKTDSSGGELCYLEYVPDSSGNWHGVMVEHGNVLNTVEALIGAYGYKSEWKYTYWGPGVFSNLIEGIFVPLRLGAAVHIFDRCVGLKDVMDYVRDKEINVVNGNVEEWLSYQSEIGFPLSVNSVKLVSLGGAGLSGNLTEWLEYLFPLAEVMKLYGEAECGQVMFYSRMPEEEVLEAEFSGRVFSNYRCYILDKNENILPVGLTGEIYIGGESVSRGYLNQPELTAGKFLEIGVGDRGFERVYRGGQRGKYLSGGDVVLSGRLKDFPGRGTGIESKESGSDENRAPRTGLERKIFEIWRKLLGIDDISVTADFFQLGGNSIKALLLVSEINKEYDLTLLITDVFNG